MFFICLSKIILDILSEEDQTLGVTLIPLFCVNLLILPLIVFPLCLVTVLVSYIKLIYIYINKFSFF